MLFSLYRAATTAKRLPSRRGVPGGRRASRVELLHHLRGARAALDEQPYGVRRFGREVVELQRAEQADGAVGDARADLCEAEVLDKIPNDEAIEAAVDLLELTSGDETREVAAWDACCGEIARAIVARVRRARAGP